MFNFYINNNWKEHHINKIHFFCLKHYSNRFDEMVFFVSIDDTTNTKEIYEFEEYIIGLNLCPNISFIVTQNHIFREAKNFYDHIALKLGDLEGLTFFAHNKGITNYDGPYYLNEEVEKWITSMYYGCLERPDEMTYHLTDARKLAYGTLLDIITDGFTDDVLFDDSMGLWLGKNRYFYMGTFFWMNCPMIKYYMENNNIELPQLVDRWYAENFFANIFDVYHCEGFDMRRTFNYTDGGIRNLDTIIEFSFGSEIDKYFDFHNYVLQNL